MFTKISFNFKGIRIRSIWMFTFALLFVATLSSKAEPGIDERYRKLLSTDSPAKDSERLNELFKVRWDYLMHEYPEWATFVGYPGQNRRWTDASPEAVARRNRDLDTPLKVINSITRSNLTPAEKLNYDLFKQNIEEDIEGIPFHGEYLSINQLGGPQQEIAELLASTMPHKTRMDYEDILARLEGASNVVSQCLDSLKLGVAAGITQPRITLRDVPKQIEAMCEPNPTNNSIIKAFYEMPADLPESVKLELRNQAIGILTNQLIPSFEKLRQFMVETYIPKSRESIGMSALPNGAAWYQHNIKSITTTTRTPEEIHELGLREVARIRAEMEALIKRTEFKGDFQEFNKFLRTDPRFYFTDEKSLLAGYRDIVKRVDPQLITLFGKLPRLPYGVKPVPKYSEKSQTTAYYEPGSLIAGRPGYFVANTYALNTRPKWEMEALALHESVPGHHLQLSLALELEEGPEFRKHQGYTAFVEGWGLYSESLGKDLGMYKDPYSEYGRLTYEIWRAIRLVVDTGLHSKGWSRQQAIDYFTANAGKSEHDITVEVDRYIVWPAQALAYKIGELKFKELKEFAKKELGDKFDIREFHDQLLCNGALPMDVLDERVRDWVASRKTQ